MTVSLPIYMDNHATTPLDPRVLETMMPFFKEQFGNSASRNHAFGWVAEEATEIAPGFISPRPAFDGNVRRPQDGVASA